MKNTLIYSGVITTLFITTVTAPSLGIQQVGITASFPLLLAFVYTFSFNKKLFRFKTYKEECYVFLLCLMYLTFQVINGNPDSIRITFFFIMVPMIMSILLKTQKGVIKVNVKKIVIIFFFVECLLAIYERIQGANIFQYTSEEENLFAEVQNWEFRSTALLGHPLTNALGVSIILGFILVSRFKLLFKLICLVLGTVAILCFNARGAALVWGGIGLYYFYCIFQSQKGKIVHQWGLVLGCIVPLLSSVYYVLYSTSLGGRLTHQDKLIDGSAQARVEVFQAFDYLRDYDFWFGNPSNYLKIMSYLGAGGVENSYVVLIIQYGLIFGIPLMFALFLFVKSQLHLYAWKQKIIILLSFILVGSFNNALAGSTPWLLFVICAQCFPYYTHQGYTHEKMRAIRNHLALSASKNFNQV